MYLDTFWPNASRVCLCAGVAKRGNHHKTYYYNYNYGALRETESGCDKDRESETDSDTQIHIKIQIQAAIAHVNITHGNKTQIFICITA